MRAFHLRHYQRVLVQRKFIPTLSGLTNYGHRLLSTNTFQHNEKWKDILCISEEVEEALATNKAVVALESTIITHGMPYPHNFSTALSVEKRVRENGAIPATIAVLNGKMNVGLTDTDIVWLAEKSNSLTKISRRDMGLVLSQGGSGGTTVSATMIAAHLAGIPIFATGGIGGVHRGAESSFDVSADLTELGRTPVAVVSSGVKSILDIPKTLEYLETQGVFVASFSETRKFPAFFTRHSGQFAPYNVATHVHAAQVIASQMQLGLQSGMLFAVPIPEEMSTAGETIEAAIQQALAMASEKKISGKDVTPFVLSMVSELTDGESLVANIALVENNAFVAGGIANCLAQLRAGVSAADVTLPAPSLQKHTFSAALNAAIASSRDSKQTFNRTSASDSSSSDSDNDEGLRNTQIGRPVVLGATVVDLTVRISDTEFKMNGGTYSGKVTQSMGGVGRNLADCLSRLGTNPVFVSAAGKDNPIKGNSHMDTSMIQLLDGQSTATYCPVLRSDGHLMFGVGDMDINAVFDVNMVKDIDNVIAAAPVVMVDGNFSPDTIQAITQKCEKASVPVWFEPADMRKAKKPFMTDAWRSLSIISPNVAELQSMHEAFISVVQADVDESSAHTIDEATSLEELLSVCTEMCRDLVTYIPVVFVTLGKHGVLLCHNYGHEATHLYPLPSTNDTPKFYAAHYPTLSDETNNIVSVSGAGDCLAAALLTAMLEGHPVDHCVYSALTCADLSLVSSDSVPASISRQSVLEKSFRSTKWRPNILSV